MDQLQKLEERLRKEGLPHTMSQTLISTGRTISGIAIDTSATVLQYPDNKRPMVSFVERTDEPGIIRLAFGDYSEYSASRICKDVYQAHDLIIAIHRALDS